MSTKPGDKRPPGRPSEYKPEYCEEMLKFMAQGYSFEAFAGHLRVCKDTLYKWLLKHPEFADAKRAATDLSRMWWEQKAQDYLVSHKDTGTLNSAVWIFNMKNRFGWRDRIDVAAHDDLPEVDESLPSMTKAQALELLKKKKAQG